jgi:hypothetical protein
MSNLSFARIMYGANQENLLPDSMPVPFFPATPQKTALTARTESAPATNGGSIQSLLHKVWHAFSDKK